MLKLTKSSKKSNLSMGCDYHSRSDVRNPLFFSYVRVKSAYPLYGRRHLLGAVCRYQDIYSHRKLLRASRAVENIGWALVNQMPVLVNLNLTARETDE